MKADSIDVPTAAAPIADILGRVGLELDALAKRLKHMQETISPLIRLIPADQREVLQEIQELDHIEQKLECLSQFMSALMPMMQGHWVLDPSEAAKVVTLSEMAQRLRAAESSIDQCHSNEFELF